MQCPPPPSWALKQCGILFFKNAHTRIRIGNVIRSHIDLAMALCFYGPNGHFALHSCSFSGQLVLKMTTVCFVDDSITYWHCWCRPLYLFYVTGTTDNQVVYYSVLLCTMCQTETEEDFCGKRYSTSFYVSHLLWSDSPAWNFNSIAMPSKCIWILIHTSNIH